MIGVGVMPEWWRMEVVPASLWCGGVDDVVCMRKFVVVMYEVVRCRWYFELV